MNRKHVNSDMDSGLGSDEDRRSKTKEQKQLHNQQLLSGCFIDASALSDDSEVLETPRERHDSHSEEERRQGTQIFQNSIPHFSMLQMSTSVEERQFRAPHFPETDTPFNSIIQLGNHDTDTDSTKGRSSLGFYVDLSEVPDEVPKTPASTSAKKNIFSMVIDFEGPKKDKPNRLNSSFISKTRNKLNKSNLTPKQNGNGSLSSSISSVNSGCVASTSRQSETETNSNFNKDLVNIEVLSASLVKNLSVSSHSSSSDSDKNIVEKNESEELGEIIAIPDSENENENSSHHENDILNATYDVMVTSHEEENNCDRGEDDVFEKEIDSNKLESRLEVPIESSESDKTQTNTPQTCPQFVKLSDIECQKPKVDINFTPRMSRSIPESHWVESPFLMSRSACYRSAPHPMEPEPCETNSDSDSSAITSSSVSQPKKSVRRLGTDLLRMFLEEVGPDVMVEVDGRKLKAHKCILASRCQYFAALLSGNWLEKSGNVIKLHGFSYESVYFSLCHIYSGAAHVPDSISLVELASLSDMLGLEGLKEVVEHALKQRHCHNFHKPCAGCCTGVLEVLPLSAAYGLDDLYQKCLQWITQNFVRVWPSRAFASLPRELREKCYQQHVVHMCPDKVLDTISACDKVLLTLPSLRWAEPVQQLVLQLTDACHLYHRQHFASVMASSSFQALDSGFGFGACQVEDQMLAAAKNLGVDQACKSYARVCKMVEQHWSRPFADLLNKIKLQLEQCLVNQADRLIRSQAWLRLDTALRTRIKELTPIAIEPQSRLPRATLLRNKNSPIIKSESYRNLSPAPKSLNNSISGTTKVANTNGSPSLRRSLLLAAKAPQVPPSPSVHRRSTLTQPTAASAAKSTPPVRASRTAPSSANSQRNAPRTAANANQIRPSSSHGSMTSSTSSLKQQIPSKRSSTSISRNPSQGKRDNMPNVLRRNASVGQEMPKQLARNSSVGRDMPSTVNRRPLSRSSSPLIKSDSRPSSRTGSPRNLDSKVTSPIKAPIRSHSPLKSDTRPVTPRRLKSNEGIRPPPVPTLQRSGTFLKDEPTVIGKVL